MAITLAEYSFVENVCAVQEVLKEAGGRDGRRVVLKGVLEGMSSVEEIEAELDAMAAAASDEAEVALCLRTGRVLMVRRVCFSRQVYRDALTAAFELTLEAALALEESDEEAVIFGSFDEDVSELEVTAGGNTLARPVIELTPDGETIRPAITIEGRTLTYDGVVGVGELLVFDAVSGVATLEGEDVTPYTEGEMPLLHPGENVVEYSDESDVPPVVDVVVRFRSRWW